MLRAVLPRHIEPGLRVIGEGAGLVVGEFHRHVRRRSAVSRRAVLREGLVVGVALLVLRAEPALAQILQNLLVGGHQRVLVVHGLAALRVPPEDFGVGTAVDAVHIVHLPAPQVLVRLRTATGVDIQRVKAQGQLDVIGPGGADTAQDARAADVLEHAQHPGDAALRRDLIDDVRLGDAKLGLGRFQIVEHHRHRAVVLILRLHGKPRQRVGARGHVGLRFRLRLGFRFRNRLLDGLRLHRRFHRFLFFPAARQAQQHHRRQEHCQYPLVHPVAASRIILW